MLSMISLDYSYSIVILYSLTCLQIIKVYRTELILSVRGDKSTVASHNPSLFIYKIHTRFAAKGYAAKGFMLRPLWGSKFNEPGYWQRSRADIHLFNYDAGTKMA